MNRTILAAAAAILMTSAAANAAQVAALVGGDTIAMVDTTAKKATGSVKVTGISGKLLGIVRVVVGGHICDLAVQAIAFDSDGERAAGGFFIQGEQLGIIVDDAAPPAQVKKQIEAGTAEAVRHLSRKYLN
jgi:hypothetical protein